MMVYRSILIFAFLAFCAAACAAERVQVPCAVQISSTASDGKHTVSEIIETARKAGLKAVILADRDLMEWEYGIWPLTNVVKKTVRQKSLFRHGLARYLAELEQIRKANPDLIVIAGVESAPFYYWKGSVFNDDLTLTDWHKHILAAGLRGRDDYAFLPVIGNRKALALPFTARNLFLLWPLCVLAAGFVVWKRGQRRTAVIVAAVGAVFLVNNAPFRYYRFDQYHGRQGARPYQDYIDYVRSRGGLTFWVHPEACNQCRIGNVRLDTEGYPLDLYRTRGYTGFSILYEGESTIGSIGGLWDRLLQSYCEGKKDNPAWAIGCLGFDETGELSRAMEDLRTVVLAQDFSEESFLSALGQGSSYVAAGNRSGSFVLDDFSVYDPESGTEKTMGQTITAGSAPLVKIRCHLLRGQPQVFTIQLIKNAKVLKEFQARTPFDMTYRDVDETKGTAYYRLVIRGEGLTVFTNPVFLKRKQP